MKVQMKVETTLVTLYLVATSKELYGIFWHKQTLPMVKANTPEHAFLQKAARQLHEYLAGKRKEFSLPIVAEGTEFQKQVWRELMKIPYGETRSYKDIAIAIKNAKACRAVGTANGKNPHSILVPCHRVIAADGTIGGYAGGLSIKKKLLALEK